MLGILLLLFGAACLASPLHRLLGARAGPLLSLVPAAACTWFLWEIHSAPSTFVERYSWLPPLGIELAFLVDGLGILFGVLVLGIGVAVLIYSAAYMNRGARLGGFFARMLFFTGAMLGLVIADDLVTFYVFWELTTIASFFLIGWKPQASEVRDAARSALIVTAMGGLTLLAALVSMAIAAGGPAGGDPLALRISSLNEIGLQGQGSYPIIVILVVVAASAKSAQAPLWFWLPAAMQAPTPVSAYLHSATMVKAGVFLLARLSPALGGTPLWTMLLMIVGGVTMVLAGIGAIGQSDLKRLLALSTISVLGAIIFLLGMGSEAAAAAAVVLIVAHALYKAALFLVAGSVERATGSRDLRELGGLGRHLPGTAVTALLAAASLAALPPLLGYVSKEKLYGATFVELGGAGLAIAVVGGITMVAAALLCAVEPFFGPRRAGELRAVPSAMTVPPFVLAVLGLTVTFAPGPLLGWMSGAASAITGSPHQVKLSLWPGTDAVGLAVLVASGVTFLAGSAVYLLRGHHGVALVVGVGEGALRWSDELASRLGRAVMAGAKSLTHLHQSGRLRSYLRTIVVTAVLAAAIPLASDLPPLATGHDVTWLEASTLGVVALGALGVIVLRGSLSAMASLGASGLGIALIFGIFSAPDLAITQVMVEALIVVMFVLTFYRLGVRESRESTGEQVGDVILSIAVGCVVTLLVLSAATLSLEPPASRAIGLASVPVGHGRNIVNVILVEVRALDTVGEITVLGTAGLGVLALLVGRRERS